jgi:hypothetical protein
MAGKLPGFITGANAKLQIIGGGNPPSSKTIAYVSDMSYTVDTLTVPVESWGRYEVLSNEPIAYGVSGSFSVIRYTKALQTNLPNSASSGNSAKELGDSTNKNSVGDQLNPGVILFSKTFDIAVAQKDASTSGITPFLKLTDCRVTGRRAALNKRGVLVDAYTFVGILAQDVDSATQTGPSGDQDLQK